MKNCMRMVSLCLVLVMMFCAALEVSAAGMIKTWSELWEDFEASGLHPMAPSMEFYSSLSWKGQAFEYSWKNMTYDFRICGPAESYISDGKGFGLGSKDWGVELSNVCLEDTSDGRECPTLSFDYTATIDLMPDEKGATTYDAMLVALYQEIPDNIGVKEYYDNNTDGRMEGTIIGRQYIKYVPAGTVNGEEEFLSGMDVLVELPVNFDPSRFIIGLAVWRVEDAPFVREGEPLSFLVSPSGKTSYLNLVDLSGFVDDFQVWTEPEPEPEETTTVTEPEPEPEPAPVRGDANGDGVLGLTDVTLVLKYVAEWKVKLDFAMADVNYNDRIGLGDVSIILKLIAGWSV